MDKMHLQAQLKQLLSRGYTINDVRHMLTAPKNLLEQVIAEYQQEHHFNQQNMSIQRQQAEYAMHLGSGR